MTSVAMYRSNSRHAPEVASDTAVDALTSQTVIGCVKNLSVSFPTREGGAVAAIREASLAVRRGEVVGLVGESGSGKTMLALSLLRLVPQSAHVDGEVIIEGIDLNNATSRELRRIRATRVGLILQDPTPSLSPLRTIGSQLSEAARLAGVPRNERRALVRESLNAVGLHERLLRRRPFELSGGMCQRVVIAMSVIKRPSLVVADEPTTALDVRTQASILRHIDSLRRQYHIAVLLVSHDLEVVRRLADRVAVMYAGRIVEVGPADSIVSDARHPYTRALLKAVPRLGSAQQRLATIPGQLKQPQLEDRGCPFRDRCEHAQQRCEEEFPSVTHVTDNHAVWCYYPHIAEGIPNFNGTH